MANVSAKVESIQLAAVLHQYQARTHVIKRVAVSLFLLDFLPIAYFGWTAHLLRSMGLGSTTNESAIKLVCFGVIPAFAAFGFSRVWLANMVYSPNTFYGQQPIGHTGLIVDPSVQDLCTWNPAKPKQLLVAPTANLLVGLAYIAGALVPFAICCFSQ